MPKRQRTDEGSSARVTSSEEELARYTRLLPFKEDLAALSFSLQQPTEARQEVASPIPSTPSALSPASMGFDMSNTPSSDEKTPVPEEMFRPLRHLPAESASARGPMGHRLRRATYTGDESASYAISCKSISSSETRSRRTRPITYTADATKTNRGAKPSLAILASHLRCPSPPPSPSRLAQQVSKDRHSWLENLSTSVIGKAARDAEAVGMLPNSLWELYLELRRDTNSASGYRLLFPTSMRDIITDRIRRGPLPDFFFHNGQNGELFSNPRATMRKWQAEKEFEVAEAIIAKATDCEENN